MWKVIGVGGNAKGHELSGDRDTKPRPGRVFGKVDEDVAIGLNSHSFVTDARMRLLPVHVRNELVGFVHAVSEAAT